MATKALAAENSRPMNMKRVMKDVKLAMEDPMYDFIYDEEGMFGEKMACYARFKMVDTPFKGQVHILKIKFAQMHPAQAPSVEFMTPVLHANVSDNGICLDILKNQWTPMYTLSHVVLSIIALLGDPNPDSALNAHAAGLWRPISRAKKSGDIKAQEAAEETYAEAANKYYNERIKLVRQELWKAQWSGPVATTTN